MKESRASALTPPKTAAQTQQLPNDWVNLARPSTWTGIEVTHMVGGPSVSDYELGPSMFCSLILRQADYQSYESTGWTDMNVNARALCFLPPWIGDTVRWNKPTEAINVRIDSDWLFGENGALTKSVIDRVGTPRYGLQDKLAEQLITEIYEDHQQLAPHGRLYSESLVLALVHRLAGTAIKSPMGGKDWIERQTMKRAVEFIHANLDRSLAVREIAEGCAHRDGLSAFCRQFRKLQGAPLHQYVMRARLDKARSLLENGSHNVTEAALACGYGNLSHFSDAFRKVHGMAPSQLMRKRHLLT
jgi:AraC family transcriptional regulator